MHGREAEMELSRLFVAVALVATASAHAGTGCDTLRLRPETSGFFLSPALDKVTVVEAKAGPGQPCPVREGDELLRINDQVVPGSKARKVMKYWESLPAGTALEFGVRRNGEIVPLVINPSD